MNKSDSSKERSTLHSGNEGSTSDSGLERSISNSVEKLIDGVIQTYFQLHNDALHISVRFLCAWLGSITLFVPTFAFSRNIRNTLSKPDGFSQIEFDDLSLSLIMLYFVGSIIVGSLIALAKTRHGHVRLYLSGFVLTAFIVVTVYQVWPTDPAMPVIFNAPPDTSLPG